MIDKRTIESLVKAAEAAMPSETRNTDDARRIASAVVRELAAAEVREIADRENMSARTMVAFAYHFPSDPVVKRFDELTKLADKIKQEAGR